MRANYEVDLPEVLLNLAACLLSQPNGVDLFLKAATLYRGHSPYSESHTTDQFDLMPSWIPYSREWSHPKSISALPSDFLEPYAWHLKDANFSACTNSPTWTSLGLLWMETFRALTDTPLMTRLIRVPSACGIVCSFTGHQKLILIPFLNVISRLKERDYFPSEASRLISPLEALARVLIAGMWNGDSQSIIAAFFRVSGRRHSVLHQYGEHEASGGCLSGVWKVDKQSVEPQRKSHGTRECLPFPLRHLL